LNEEKLHINNELNEDHFDGFFENAEVHYSKSEQDVWQQLEQKIGDGKTVSMKKQFFPYKFYSVAAAIIVLFGILAFLRFNTESIVAVKGQHLVYSLPDGSKVSLNAESSIKFHPYWWRFSRKLEFEGEAFFEVEKGSKFQVASTGGKTEVLGTSFNIYSREGNYNVACMSGKVRVVSPQKHEVILTPSYMAEVGTNGMITVRKFSQKVKKSDWMNNMFSFTSVPLIEVLNEVERQFNVKIYSEVSNELIYTGHFTANRNIEEVLDVLCKPFGLEVEKVGDNTFRLK